VQIEGYEMGTLRTASLAYVYSSVEYSAPVWLNNAHVHKLDVQLNNVMRHIQRIILDCIFVDFTVSLLILPFYIVDFNSEMVKSTVQP
jgi:hypothetical protein